MNEATFRIVTDQIIQDAQFFLPEVALTATICLVILLDLVLKQRDSRQLAWVALAGVFASGLFLSQRQLDTCLVHCHLPLR